MRRKQRVRKMEDRWPACLHCKRKRPCPNRGLCRKCYRTPAIRDNYPVSNVQVRSSGTIVPNNYRPDTNRIPDVPPWATQAQPGSEAKIIVMEIRAGAGMQVFHPDDKHTRCTPQELHLGADCL